MDESNKKPGDSTGDLEGSTANAIDTTNPDALNSSVAAAPGEASPAPKKGFKLPTGLQKFSHRFNIYLLFFVLILVIAGAILIITAMASRETKDPSVIDGSQNLSSDTLKQLSNADSTVGDPKQVLNVQSNAVFAGKVLVRDNLEVAGTIRVGGSMSLPGITVSGESNFDSINVSKNLVSGGDTTVQGQLNVRRNVAASGGGTFGGPLTAPQISTSNLQLLGDLTLTRHIVAGGATPGRTVGGSVGNGGSASVSGSDTAGFININTGSAPSAGCFVTVNFVTRYTSTPRVLLTPVGSDAGPLTYYVNRSSSNFSVCVSTVPPANASFGFDYFVLN